MRRAGARLPDRGRGGGGGAGLLRAATGSRQRRRLGAEHERHVEDYSPAFIGNGYLAARVPAAGEGYGVAPITTQSELAGFYAAPDGQYERRASLPTWTTLGFGRSGGVYGIPGSWSCAFDQLCPAMYGQISGGAFVESSHPGGSPAATWPA